MKKNDFLNQYLSSRKSLIKKTLITFLFLFILSFILFNKKHDSPFVGKISLEGIIKDKFEILEEIENIQNNENAKGLLIIVNSPGGTFVSSKEVYNAIEEISKKIPTAVYMREIATSGAYLAALGANRIFLSEGTITGSIGVILQTADFTNLLEKLGINPLVVKSGDLKAVPNPIEKIDEKKLSYINKIISQMQSQFLETVKKTRNINEQTIELISDGRIFTGNQAKKLNLVDELGFENDALDWIKNEAGLDNNVKVIDFDDDNNIFSTINLDILRKKINGFDLSFNNGILAIWVPGL
mgnify:CR=1 FL=1